MALPLATLPDRGNNLGRDTVAELLVGYGSRLRSPPTPQPCLAIMGNQPNKRGAESPSATTPADTATAPQTKRRSPAVVSTCRGTVPGKHSRNQIGQTDARSGLRPAVRQPVVSGKLHTTLSIERKPGRLSSPRCCGRETVDTGTRQPSPQKRWPSPRQQSMARRRLTHAEDMQSGVTTPPPRRGTSPRFALLERSRSRSRE